MDQNPMNRRALLRRGLGFFVAVPVSVAALQAFGQAAKTAAKPATPAAKPAAPAAGAKLKLVDPATDPVAKALKYTHDAAKADPKVRIAKMGVAGDKQHCQNCQLFSNEGVTEDGTKAGKCSMIAGGAVTVNGWCTSWIKNPKVPT